MMAQQDLIVLGDWVWAGPGKLMERAGVVVRSGAILEVGTQADLLAKYPQAKRAGGDGRFVIPGMISTHTHYFQTFLKGIGQGLPLRTWIQTVTSPASVTMSEREAYLSAAVGIIDAVRSGTTSIFEFAYAFPNPAIFDAIVQAHLDLGVRGWLGIGVNDTGEDYGLNPALIQPLGEIPNTLDRLTASIRKLGRGLVQPAVAPSSIRGMSKDAIAVIAEYVHSNDLIFSLHVNETPIDNDVAQAKFGKMLIPGLAESGALNDRFLAVHCVRMTPEDIALFAESGVGVSHNPVSNMYLGSGVAPITAMRKAGIPISLGVDGAASNNSQDMIETLKFAVLGQRAALADPSSIQAVDGLIMATVGGAHAMRSANQLGVLEPGYKADLTVLNFNTAKSTPAHDPVGTLVFNSGEENVETVLVDGKPILEAGKLVTIDEEKLLREANAAARNLIQRANIQAR
ncbi:MAG: amidohydrolase family protein [Anaerolineaceae bacterium]|nr:amidohydrolase family protein [Anaerolineaceae bacterium]